MTSSKKFTFDFYWKLPISYLLHS